MTKDEWDKKFRDFMAIDKKHYLIFKIHVTIIRYDPVNNDEVTEDVMFVVADNFDHARELVNLKPRKGYINIKSIELVCNAVEYDIKEK